MRSKVENFGLREYLWHYFSVWRRFLTVLSCNVSLISFQSNCKLFLFNTSTQNWVERGRGLLRLNDSQTPCDSESFQSRIGEYLLLRFRLKWKLSLSKILSWRKVTCICFSRILSHCFYLFDISWTFFILVWGFRSYKRSQIHYSLSLMAVDI